VRPPQKSIKAPPVVPEAQPKASCEDRATPDERVLTAVINVHVESAFSHILKIQEMAQLGKPGADQAKEALRQIHKVLGLHLNGPG